jgi:uncharacterized membrane protein YphA (DoxX/SURF4 family)
MGHSHKKNQLKTKLIVLACLYCLAALIHFTHNAEFLTDYPNMPQWITRSGVYFVWAAEALIGVLGLVLLWRGFTRSGVVLLMLYAALGFDGLLHYSLAPMAAHTFAMNFTIWLEVIAGAFVIVYGAKYLFALYKTNDVSY